MATQRRQCQLSRYLFVLVSLTLSFAQIASAADDGLLGIAASGYRLARGASFFLLADSSFTPNEEATLRLEGPTQALQRYDGVDILLYRIDNPLEFLRRQNNLHRIQQPGRYDGEGLANALHYVWDVWYKKSRLAWQRLFSAEARSRVVVQAPLLSQSPPHSYATEFEDNPQYQPLSGLPLLHRFRYPLWEAEPLEPAAAGVQLQGSSHNLMEKRTGNVRLPLGKLAPGLYLVEGLLGQFRASTLLFVANTVAINKTSGQQMMVWTSNKSTGQAVGGVKLLLGDGAGILQETTSNAEGIALFDRPSPERSYLLGLDAQGGVLVAENLYYDSEIHAAHLYAFTDRPLYRPGDTVHFKLVGRQFQQANRSEALQSGPLSLLVLDPNGHPVHGSSLHLEAQSGGDGAFQLPEQAPAGGYTLRFTYQNEPYTASFRVASFNKPHYELEILLDQESYQTGQAIQGTIRAFQPGGQPLGDLNLELNLRSQAHVFGAPDPASQGRFPVLLQNKTLQTDAQGKARFELPAASSASHYFLRVSGNDGSSYRVSSQRAIAIEPASPRYLIHSPQQLSQPDSRIPFTLERLPSPPGEATTWSVVRLEDQSKQQGSLQGDRFLVHFTQAGSYAIQVLDAQGMVLGATSHWISGQGLQAPAGSIVIHTDKTRYRPGETVQALVTFPSPVREALLTLEQEQVHQVALLGSGASWLRRQRISEQQWLLEIPVDAQMQPNRVLSVLTVENGTFLFQNKGLHIDHEPLAIALHSDRTTYQPGERVQVEVTTRQGEHPLPAHLSISVVDEAVYLLQAELAPDIRDFFGHWRRNQVRTSSSLQFHTYDQAVAASKMEGGGRFRRPAKVLQRPRRENIDTALWLPHLRSDSNGKAHFEFTLPDAITRWRMTARATTEDGLVGQQVASVVADKAAYLKWSAPTRFRQGDQVQGVLTAFNNRSTPLPVQLLLHSGDKKEERTLSLQPGSNPLPIALTMAQDLTIRAELRGAQQQSLDQLVVPLTMLPLTWNHDEQLTVPLKGDSTPVALPADAQQVQVVLAEADTQAWWRVANDLIDYPYGCAEQTASRLLPLTLAYRTLRLGGAPTEQLRLLRNRIANQRLRLAQMAGPEAGFGWWGDQGKGDPFFTAYAYVVEARALQALAIAVPANHWFKLLDVLRQESAHTPPLQQALSLWLAQDLGLPVQHMATGLAQTLLAQGLPPYSPSGKGGVVLGNPNSGEAHALTLLLLDMLLNAPTITQAELHKESQQAAMRLTKGGSLLAQAALLRHKALFGSKKGITNGDLAQLLAQAASNGPTVDRALTLLLLANHLTAAGTRSGPELALKAPWIRQESLPGLLSWRWPTRQGSLPSLLSFNQPAAAGWNAHLRYQRPSAGKPTLPIRISRRLFRLTPVKERPPTDYYADNPIETLFDAHPVNSDHPLATQALYLDQLTLESKGGPFRYGLLEVPLPPGGERDPFTWGMAVNGIAADGKELLLTDSGAEDGPEGYRVPIAALGKRDGTETLTLHHLVRFTVHGTLQLPAARYFSMYDPSQWASGKQGLLLRMP
ncbi:MAG: alpha-2-macroglobulin family protein [Magnetococcales bacterium]|nr:alpha-2-macroglobulin family protein [Magnetococcales bacterium]